MQKIYPSFCCERHMPEHNGAKNLKLDKNIDDADVRSQEIVAAKFK